MKKENKFAKEKLLQLAGSNTSRLLQFLIQKNPDYLKEIASLLNIEEQIEQPREGHYGDGSSRPRQPEKTSSLSVLLNSLTTEELKEVITPSWFTSEYGSLNYENFFKEVYKNNHFGLVEHTLPMVWDILTTPEPQPEEVLKIQENKITKAKKPNKKNTYDFIDGDILNFIHKWLEELQVATPLRLNYYQTYLETNQKEKKNEFLKMWDFVDTFCAAQFTAYQKSFYQVPQEKIYTSSLLSRLSYALYYADKELFQQLEEKYGPEKIKSFFASPPDTQSYGDRSKSLLESWDNLDKANVAFVYHLQSNLELAHYLKEKDYVSADFVSSLEFRINQSVIETSTRWAKITHAPKEYQQNAEQIWNIYKNHMPEFLKTKPKNIVINLKQNHRSSYDRRSDSEEFVLGMLFTASGRKYIPALYAFCKSLNFAITSVSSDKGLDSTKEKKLSLTEWEFRLTSLLCEEIQKSLEQSKVLKKPESSGYRSEPGVSVLQTIVSAQEKVPGANFKIKDLANSKKPGMSIDLGKVSAATHSACLAKWGNLDQAGQKALMDNLAITIENILLNVSITSPTPDTVSATVHKI